jgi:hypothetical protein
VRKRKKKKRKRKRDKVCVGSLWWGRCQSKKGRKDKGMWYPAGEERGG